MRKVYETFSPLILSIKKSKKWIFERLRPHCRQELKLFKRFPVKIIGDLFKTFKIMYHATPFLLKVPKKPPPNDAFFRVIKNFTEFSGFK